MFCHHRVHRVPRLFPPTAHLGLGGGRTQAPRTPLLRPLAPLPMLSRPFSRGGSSVLLFRGTFMWSLSQGTGGGRAGGGRSSSSRGRRVAA